MKEPYVLPEKDCKRACAGEMAHLKLMLAYENSVTYASKGLQDRLKTIPHGVARMRMAIAGLKSVLIDIQGTMPVNQIDHLTRTMTDCAIQMVPRMTPKSTNVVISAEDLAKLINEGRAQCVDCVEDANECRSCHMYQLMEKIMPLDKWSNGFGCPYSNFGIVSNDTETIEDLGKEG